MKATFKSISLLLLILVISCNNDGNQVENSEHLGKRIKNDSDSFSKLPYDDQLIAIKKHTSVDSFLSNDFEFIFKNIIKRELFIDLKKYDIENCYPIRYKKESMILNFEGFNNIGDIDKDKHKVLVFVLSPLNYCDSGQSYYFTNVKIPRLSTNSYCCQPQNLFNVGDIDEDGICEIGQYYSSCASRFKALIVLTLKNGSWYEIGRCTFDLNYSYPDLKNFKKYVRKRSKNKFQMLEITDLTKKEYIGKRNWIDFEIK